MKKFRFRLEKVLQFRETIKTEKKRELSKRLAILREAEDKLDALYKSQAENNMPEEGVYDAALFFMRGQFSGSLKKLIDRQKIVILDAEKKADEARVEYIEASKEVKTLDMLKAKRKEQYEDFVRHEEAKVLDESATQRAGRVAALNGE